MASFFAREYITFFQNLERNNHKEWFHANRDSYETNVRQPFLEFVSATAREIQKDGWNIEINPSHCISRINRYIRFSKDKSPYNLYMTVFFSNHASKDKSLPGIFLRFGARNASFMVVCYGPDTKQLKAIRRSISNTTEIFQKILKNQTLARNFGTLQGERSKRLPREFKETESRCTDIGRKQFYFVREEKPAFLLKPDLLKRTMELWKASKPFNEFLMEAYHGVQ